MSQIHLLTNDSIDNQQHDLVIIANHPSIESDGKNFDQLMQLAKLNIFTGTVKKVVFDLKPVAHEDEQLLHEQIAQAAVGYGAAG